VADNFYGVRQHVRGAHMINIEQRNRTQPMLQVTAHLIAMALLYSALPSVWPSVAWSQQSSIQVNSPIQAQAEPRRRLRPASAAQPSPVEPSTQDPTTISLPAADLGSPLGSELESCAKADGVEPVSLPGLKGEIKLDRCYRGRDRLVCSFQALSSEATLLENYRNIVDANYPEFGSIDDVCRIEPDSLATDLKNAAEFASRFKILKAEYDSRVNCANKVEQSLQDVILPDMTQAPAMLKSMIDSIDETIKGASAPQAQVAELAEKINSSRKALLTIQKIHQTMCRRDQTATARPEDGNALSGGPSPNGSSSTTGSLSPNASSSPTESPSSTASASTNPANTGRYYIVLDPVDSCAVIETKQPSLPLNAIGDKRGYASLAAANKALNTTRAKCRRAVIE
jgi:hypothetical protein